MRQETGDGNAKPSALAMTVIKVWNSDRSVRKAVVLQDVTMKQLKEKGANLKFKISKMLQIINVGSYLKTNVVTFYLTRNNAFKVCEKFNLDTEDQYVFYLEKDGTVIDEDELLLAFTSEVLIVSKGEPWAAPNKLAAPAAEPDQNESSKEKLVKLFERMKERNRRDQVGGKKKKTFRKSIKIQLGWQHYCPLTHRWTQVRAAMEGGSRFPEMAPNATHDDVLQKAKDLFFPSGSNRKGHLTDMEVFLGDFAERKLDPSQFPLDKYIEQECLTLKPRIYLMTKTLAGVEEKKKKKKNLTLDDLYNEEIHQRKSKKKTLKRKLPAMSLSSSSDSDLPDVTGITELLKTPTHTQTQAMLDTPCTSGTQQALQAEIPRAIQDMIQSDTQQGELSQTVQTIMPEASVIQYEGQVANTPPGRFLDADSPTVNLRLRNEEKGNSTCTICMDRPKSAFLLQCGHSFCMVCAVQLESNKSLCPICRNPISKICNIFD